MLQVQLKLRPCKAQEQIYDQWLYNLASVYNFAVRKIELNAKDKIYFSKNDFQNLLANHGEKLGIPSHTIQGVLCTVHDAWKRCFKKTAGKPKLKGMRNKMSSIPFPDPIKAPKGNRITLPGLGSVRFHKQEISEGKIKCGRLIKRASGWYLCLFIDAEPNPIKRLAFGAIGIDPGFSNLLTTSDGEVIEHPRELEAAAERLGQAQRGHNKQLAARIQERIANRKKDRNHKLTTKLVSENVLIVWSKDAIKGIAKRFGKSVNSSSHAQIRQMLSYKMPKSGGTFIEVASKYSTKTCNECGNPTGPTGLAGLSVRQWECNVCGAQHDRDINAAINTLAAAAGCAVEGYAYV
jgi:putative transposase